MALDRKLAALPDPTRSQLLELLSSEPARNAPDQAALLDMLSSRAQEAQDVAIADEEWDAWDDALLVLEGIKQEDETFKDPEVLRYI